MLWRWRLWRHKQNRLKPESSLVQRFITILRWGGRLLLLFLAADIFYLYLIWPQWQDLGSGAIPRSNFIRIYQLEQKKHPDQPRLKWQPVSMDEIPHHVQRAVIVGEDARFYEHGGFDFLAFRDAMDTNLERGRFRFGASTLSQQTVKNLFLSSSRNPLRKWHELILTWGMESALKKRRILEIYLNIAEFGHGVYGVQAASRYYWGKPVSALSLAEAARLAATLPSPRKHNPATDTRAFNRRVERIAYWLKRSPGKIRQ